MFELKGILLSSLTSLTKLLFLLLLLFNWSANGVLPGGSGITIRHNTKIHITQNYNTTLKQNSTQSYTNNKGHITHNEYNTKEVKLSLQ
jgi:cell division protein FtsL